MAPLLAALAGCGIAPETSESPDVATASVWETLRLEPVDIREVPEVERMDMQDFQTAFLKSCAAILNKAPDSSYGPSALGGQAQDWQAPCRAAQYAGAGESRVLLADYFNMYAVYDQDDTEGLFTGYFEPLLYGAHEPSDRYNVPLYAVPDDLVEVDLGAFSEDFKGRKISGKLKGRKLVPFDDRAGIDAGALSGRGLELAWVDDAADAFFLHIQGSGVIEFEDGTRQRIGYAAQNGHAYYAIGKALIARGEIPREDMSLQAIRSWLERHPDQAAALMQENPSYVFFRMLDNDLDGPLGAQGVPLTPEASLAVDRRLYPYGMPVLLSAAYPIEQNARITRLMVAQDTGGAIRGAVRGDVFWGAGDLAALRAGHMKSRGRMWIFLPKTIEVPENVMDRPGIWDKIRPFLFFWKD